MRDKFRVYKIKPEWMEEATRTAKERRNYHAERGSKRHWHDPAKGEYADEVYGSLAQIAFREMMKRKRLTKICEFSPLFTEEIAEMPIWDALVDGRTIDIKATPPDTGNTKRVRMLVKVREFKQLDFYVAIKFWNDEEYSFCGFATGAEVASTPRVNFGYAPAHWFFLDQLPHKLEGEWWKLDDKSRISSKDEPDPTP